MSLLSNKVAVIYGAAGSLGRTVASTFAREGAVVYLAGRTAETLEAVKKEIESTSGKAIVAEVDAMKREQVEQLIESIMRSYGRLDISPCAVSLKDTQGIGLVDMTVEDFTRPVLIAMDSQFNTACAAGRTMRQQKNGVILTLTATPGGSSYPFVGGFGPACAAIEQFASNLASELGTQGVRVVNVRSAGSVDSEV